MACLYIDRLGNERQDAMSDGYVMFWPEDTVETFEEK